MDPKRSSDLKSPKSREMSLRKLIREKREEKIRASLIPDMEGPVVDDPYKPTYDYSTLVRKSTAYGYIPSLDHYSPWDENYPECPVRSTSIHEGVQPLIDRVHIIEDKDMIEIADEELLGLVHPPDGINLVKQLCVNDSELEAQSYDSIYYNGEKTYKCAVEAARMAVTMSKLIAKGQYQNGFANVRPPGHHALPANPNGYCLFNNVAIAAKYLLKHNLAEKILIVDYDVHHGQGTQHIFYETDQVLYFSIHRYEHGTFWPNLKESNFDHIGDKKGKGFNINVPLNDTKLTDYDYLAIILNVLIPVAYEFNPSIILVSAGYDACVGCPEGCMLVTPAFYGHLITSLSGLAQGKISVILEGGYCIPSLADAGLRTIRALLGDPCHSLEYHKCITPSVVDTIINVKFALRQYWKCFQIEPLCKIENISSFDRYNYHLVVKHFIGVPEAPPYPTRGYYPGLTPSENLLVEAYINLLKNERYDLRQTLVGYMINQQSGLHQPSTTQPQEIQDRLEDIVKKLDDFNLLAQMVNLKFSLISGRPSNWSDINMYVEKLHDNTYLTNLNSNNLPSKPDVYVCPSSKDVCLWSVCILCQLGMKIKEKKISHGVGIIRPPGHHAKCSEAGGFCLINNIVVTADYLINSGFKKVLIVDFDVHHGDGTQQLTYDRQDIMYISMHRYDNNKFFPKDKSGNYTFFGSGIGYGYNINIPFSNEKMTNSDYLHTWIKIVVPVSYSYNPDIILVSAGFDAGIHDPLGNYSVAPETFGHLIQLLKPVAPVLLVLEGGYNLETTSLSMVNCVRALLGHPLPMPVLKEINREAKNTIEKVITVAKTEWPILQVNKKCDADIREEYLGEVPHVEETTA